MKKILLNIVLAWCICGCSDFLEPKSPSEFVPKTADALNGLLLGEAYPTATSSQLFCFHNALDDDIEMSDEELFHQSSAFIETLQLVYSWNPELFELSRAGSLSQIWSMYYQRILGANSVLDYLEDVSGTVEEKASVRAQAYTLRAFYYFNLVNLFGGPYNHDKSAAGVPLKLTSDLTDGFDTRATVSEVYDRILKDLDEAEKNFAVLSEKQQKSMGYRINLPAMQLLRARVCLHMENMEGAAKYARKVIDDWGYELYDMSGKVDTLYVNYMTLDNPETIWMYGSPDDVTSMLALSATMNDAGKTVAYTLNASRDLVASFSDEYDLRGKYYLVQELRGPQNATADKLKPAEGHYLPWSKCALQADNRVKTASAFAFSFRLSEAYLILAEAVYDTDEELALQLINDLREKRFTAGKYDAVSYSGKDLLNFIREERRRELCFEGQRWFDLRRYGMPTFKHRWVENGIVVGNYVMEQGDAAYTLPIPFVAIERNPALKQNELTTPKTL